MDLFQEIHNFEENKTMLKSNLSRRRQNLVAKLKDRVFPIHIKTGRYKGTKREKRFCLVCDRKNIEDNEHFLFKCEPLKTTRKSYIRAFKRETGLKCKGDWKEALKIMIDKDHIKEFAVWLEDMYLTRRAIVYRS